MNEYAKRVLMLLEKAYPDVDGTALKFSNAWELLVATILSAQCTDERVNKVTEVLFKRFKTPLDFVNADIEELQEIIRPTGFYRNKAKFIKEVAKRLVEEYNSEVPNSMEELIKLPGVARKTANLVLSNAYHIVVGIAVDTHVKRVSQRLGLTKERVRDKIERDLMNLFPKDKWFELTNLLVVHGRHVCTAKHPRCKECILNSLCPSAFKFD